MNAYEETGIVVKVMAGAGAVALPNPVGAPIGAVIISIAETALVRLVGGMSTGVITAIATGRKSDKYALEGLRKMKMMEAQDERIAKTTRPARKSKYYYAHFREVFFLSTGEYTRELERNKKTS
jgi:hypothetical protein